MVIYIHGFYRDTAREVIAFINVPLCNTHNQRYKRKSFDFAMYMFKLNFDYLMMNI